MVLRRLELPFQSEPLKQLAQLPNQVVEGISWRSYSSLATISASSTWIYSEDWGWPRRRERAAVAAAMLPRLTK